jgi:hypothetical protein
MAARVTQRPEVGMNDLFGKLRICNLASKNGTLGDEGTGNRTAFTDLFPGNPLPFWKRHQTTHLRNFR